MALTYCYLTHYIIVDHKVSSKREDMGQVLLSEWASAEK